MSTIIGPRSDNFRFMMPGHLFFGRGVASRVGERAKSLGMKKVLIVTDSFVSHSPACQILLESLARSELQCGVWDQVVSDPTDTSVAAGTHVFRDGGYDGLIGVGGGSSIDTAKGIGALAANGGDWVLSFAENPKTLRKMVPLIGIPTTSGTGSEVTGAAVITDSAKQFKSAINGPILCPPVAMVDPDLTASMPREMTIGTGMDALAHAVEAYTSSTENPISDAMALYAIELVLTALPIAAANGDDMPARTDMSLAATLAGAAFNAAALGANHSIAHALGERYHIHHGLACGVALASMLEYNLEAKRSKIARLAPLFGVERSRGHEQETADTAIAGLQRFIRGMGVPDMVRQRIAGPVDIQGVAELALAQHITRFNPRPIDVAGFVEVLQRTFAE